MGPVTDRIARDFSTEVVARGRRLRGRRRVRRAAGATVLALALPWEAHQAPRWDLPRQNPGFVAANDVSAADRARQEALIATFLEQHRHFDWIDDSGGTAVCAVQELGEHARPDGTLRVYVWALCENRGGAVGTSEGSRYAPSIRANFSRSLGDIVLNQEFDRDELREQLNAR